MPTPVRRADVSPQAFSPPACWRVVSYRCSRSPRPSRRRRRPPRRCSPTPPQRSTSVASPPPTAVRREPSRPRRRTARPPRRRPPTRRRRCCRTPASTASRSPRAKIYARTTSQILVSSESGSLLGSFAMPTRSSSAQALGHNNEIGTVVVDPLGNIYFVEFNSGASVSRSSRCRRQGRSTGASLSATSAPSIPGTMAPGTGRSRSTARALRTDLVSESGQVVCLDPAACRRRDGSLADAVRRPDRHQPGDPERERLRRDRRPDLGLALRRAELQLRLERRTARARRCPSASLGGAVEIGSTIYVDDYASNGSGLDLFTTTGVLEGAIAATHARRRLARTRPSPTTRGAESCSGWPGNVCGGGDSPRPSTSSSRSRRRPLKRTASATTWGRERASARRLPPTTSPQGARRASRPPSSPGGRAIGDPLELSYWVANGDQVQANATPAPTIQPLSWSG